MARSGFAGKAGTLALLAGRLQAAVTLPQRTIRLAEWQRDQAGVLAQLATDLAAAGWERLVVRSSAVVEDHDQSYAGAFHSEIDVAPADLGAALHAVFASLPGAADDCALVQPLLTHTRSAGVAFGVDPEAGGPYYVINYDPEGSTDAVTSGRTNALKTWWVHHAAPETALEQLPPDLTGVVALLHELRAIFQTPAIDIEFAIGVPAVKGETQARLTLLQARPLQAPALDEAAAARLTAVVGQIARGVAGGTRPHPFLHGQRTVYGVMPDWNPAEIIGVRPRPLALSLYRELVTDAVWAYQRHNYGYRNLRSFPLLVHFHGLPYIDVRVSFNSFVPRDIEGRLADKLVNHYIDRLLELPALHDKVEFDIVFSCYTFDLPQRLQRLADAGFSADEVERLAESLKALTNRVIDREHGLWKDDRAKLDTLAARREQTLASDLDLVGKLYWLLEDCKRYGTLPFAGLARAGFIAVQLLRSLQAVGVLSPAEADAFLASLDTVSGRMARDFATLDRTTFLSRYGHLRPGTYDLLSPRYDEAPDLYFGAESETVRHEGGGKASSFALSLGQMRTITALLHQHGINHDVVGLFDFIEAGITLREYAKFEFTRNLSDALSLLKRLGADYGFDTEAMSFADVGVVHELYASSADPAELLAASIAAGRERFAETRRLVLPPLLCHADEVWVHAAPDAAPNFVTHGVAVGPVVALERPDERTTAALAGAIVAIPSADPGYDWLFAHPIAGFITAYGGVNSHMAIRANELSLPAVIGAGEPLYRRWATAPRLKLDCEAKRVEVLG